jgi:hypothetical protein
LTDRPAATQPGPAATGRSPIGAPARPLTCGQRLRRALRLPKALCALRPVQRKRRVFSGGQSPMCLKRKLVRSAERSRQLRQLCRWIEKPSARPRLREGPLLGHCLEDLTAETEARAGGETQSRPPRTSLPPYPDSLRLPHFDRTASPAGQPGQSPSVPIPEPWAAHRPPTLTQVAAHPRPGPFALPGPASREILNRFLAAPSQVRARRALLSASWPRSARRPVSNGRSASGNLGPGGRASSAALAASAARPAGEMAARLARGLARFVQSRLGSAIGTGGPGRFDGATDWTLAALSAQPAGPGAPFDLLLRAAGAAAAAENWREGGPQGRRGAGGASSSNEAPARRPGAGPLTTGESFLHELAERSGERLEGARSPIESLPVPEAPAPRPEPPEGARQGFYPQTGALPLPEAGRGGGRPLVAPPLAADTPPTLLQPRFPFDAPSPFATATLRREAQRDEVDLAQEDLDLLAARIKRILDEEARRYGIDV